MGSSEAAIRDFWAVYDSHFEDVYRRVIEATRDHPVLGARIRSATFEQIGGMSKDYRLLVQRAIEGDPAPRDAYLRQVAHAYADAGVSFAGWSVYDSSLVDLLTPLIVAEYGSEPARMIAALKALREFTHRTTVILAGAYIEEKERALVESEARYRQLVDRSPESIVVQVEGRVAFANDSAAQTLGFADRSELVGRELADLRAADVAPTSMASTAVRAAPEGPVESVERYTRLDGREVTLEVRSIPIVYEGRKATFAVARNVTERLEAEAARRKALAAVDLERRRLAAILDALPIGIWIADADGSVSYTNPGAAKVFGGRAPRPAAVEQYGDQYQAVWPATGKPVISEEWPLARTLRTGQPVVREAIDVLGFDGTRAHVLFSSVPIPGSDGQPDGAMVIGLDMSDQQRSLQERERLLASLEIAAQRMRAQFKAMPVATYAWQRRVQSDGRVEFVLHDYNDAAMLLTRGGIAKTIGFTAAELLGSSADAMVADMTASLAEGRSIRREVAFAMATTGETRRFLATYASVPPDLVLAHTEDITERFELEEQLRSAQKMEAIGRLAGGVAHDFNNILSVILGYTSLMIDDLPLDDPMRNDVVEMATAAQRAVALTQQLLALGRRQVLQPQRMDLVASVRGLEPMLKRLLGEGIEMSMHAGPAVGDVFADPTQIDQVIMNLVVNARDAMPTGGRLAIELEDVTFDAADAARAIDIRPDRYVMLAVTDSGTGMDAATQAKIFEPFFTTKEQGKGTGLGLATVFGVVRQSDGVVRAESEIGKGTTMRVYLPRVDGERIEGSKPSSSSRADAPRGKETILLVEDDAQVRVLAGNVLRRQGYKVIEADSGPEAILLSEQYEAPIDLLLTDVVMPRMSGRELAERLAPARPQMTVLFMSGYTDDAVVRHGVATSGRAFLQKPVTAIELARKVRSVIDAASPTVIYPKTPAVAK